MINKININALVPSPCGATVYSEAMQCATVRHTSCPTVAHFYLGERGSYRPRGFVLTQKPQKSETLRVAAPSLSICKQAYMRSFARTFLNS